MKSLIKSFLSKPIEYSSTDFVARIDNGKFKPTVLLFLAVFIFLIIYRWKIILQWPVTETILFLLVVLPCMVFFLFKAFDKRPKLIITKSGIWMTSTGFMSWEGIWYFDIEEVKEKNYFFFIFRGKASGKEHKVNVAEFDKSYNEIYAAITDYSKGYNIVRYNG